MAVQEVQNEPTMEEILASIRRIISEDDAPPPAPVAAPPSPKAMLDTFELTKPVDVADDDLVAFHMAPEPAPPVRKAPEPMPAPAPARPAAMVPELDLVGPAAAQQAASAFARLTGAMAITSTPGQTVEGLVRELLRPMLKDWLDSNLPSIVESAVEAEVKRLSRAS